MVWRNLLSEGRLLNIGTLNIGSEWLGGILCKPFGVGKDYLWDYYLVSWCGIDLSCL